MTAADVRTARRAHGRRPRVLVAGGCAVAVLAGGGVAWAMTRSTGRSYRLATAEISSLHEMVTTSGTVRTAKQATLAFPVSGQVADVAVSVGDTVTAGQTLATLNRSALEQALQSARATAATARQTLADDEATQTSTGTEATNSSYETPLTANTPRPSPSQSSSAGSGKPTGNLASLVEAVQRAQNRVLADQHRVDLDGDVATADRAVVAAQASCRALLGATATPSSAGPSGAPSVSPSGGPDGLSACQSAIRGVQQAQATVQSDEDSLAADEKALDDAVTALVSAVSASGETTPPGSTKHRNTDQTAPSASAASPSRSSGRDSGTKGGGSEPSVPTRTITAAQLAADQKAIDAADAAVTVAKQNLASARLRAPLAGTVAAVSITPGQSLSAGSSSATITVLGRGQKSVTTTIGIADVDHVKVGTAATVTIDGVSRPLSGRVSYVGVLNTSGTSGATTTYPVTVLLDATSTPLYDGAGATVSLDIGTASHVLTVPTSAVHGLGKGETVLVYAGGKVTTVAVTTGLSGTDRVQITSGLHAGQRVVLADVGAAIPTSGTDQRGFGGAGGGLRRFVVGK